ncbi:MAG TPA: hypothetical protein VN683_12510 [Acidothermaceae bacterium]|nr:hypothetical protein [Acidothermaceae bacterium]
MHVLPGEDEDHDSRLEQMPGVEGIHEGRVEVAPGEPVPDGPPFTD